MPRPRNRIRLESQHVAGFEKSLGWISNPRVAGSIPAAPTNLFYSLEANLTLSHCKLTASWEQLEHKTEKFFAGLLPIRANTRLGGEESLTADHTRGWKIRSNPIGVGVRRRQKCPPSLWNVGTELVRVGCYG